MLQGSDAASGRAGWALAHPEFGVSVNPIPTRGGALCFEWGFTRTFSWESRCCSEIKV